MNRRRILVTSCALLLTLAGCASSDTDSPAPVPDGQDTTTSSPKAPQREGRPFVVQEVARFDEPWAMTFLPDGKALITDRGGTLFLLDPATGAKTEVGGTPQVKHGGQGGLGDVVLAPSFNRDRGIYLSWAEGGPDGTAGAVVGRAQLSAAGEPRLEGLQVIWRQEPKTTGSGHFSHRIAVSPDQRYLFVSAGDRQKMNPAQDLSGTLGKILRLNLDGTAAAGNPFADRGGVSTQIWTYGHRNVLGMAFDPAGNLWASEMGPKGGDEVNLIERGRNYGWPKVSNGSHYDGGEIPDHADGDGYAAPKVWWNPSVSPGSLLIYTGDAFPQWKGDAFLGALSGRALIRVDLDGTTASKADQWDMGARIRAVQQGPDGALWLLEDTPSGRLVKLTPPQ